MKKLKRDKEKRQIRERDDQVSIRTWRSSRTSGREKEEKGKQGHIREVWKIRYSHEKGEPKEYSGALGKINLETHSLMT